MTAEAKANKTNRKASVDLASAQFVSPKNKVKRVEATRTAADELMAEFKKDMERRLSECENWTSDQWLGMAGLYADTAATMDAIFNDDCLGMFVPLQEGGSASRGRPEGRAERYANRKIKPGLENGYSLGSRFVARLFREGPAAMAKSVQESYDVGMSWQARSKDRMEIASIFGIAY